MKHLAINGLTVLGVSYCCFQDAIVHQLRTYRVAAVYDDTWRRAAGDRIVIMRTQIYGHCLGKRSYFRNSLAVAAFGFRIIKNDKTGGNQNSYNSDNNQQFNEGKT